MYLSELDRNAHELLQLMLLTASAAVDHHSEDDVEGPPWNAGGGESATDDEVTDEFLRQVADRLRRKATLAERTLRQFLLQTTPVNARTDATPAHTPVMSGGRPALNPVNAGTDATPAHTQVKSGGRPALNPVNAGTDATPAHTPVKSGGRPALNPVNAGTDATPAYTPVNFTGKRTTACRATMTELTSHLSNVVDFLTNVTAPRLLINATAADNATADSTWNTTLSEAAKDWRELTTTATLPACACPTPAAPPADAPVYVTPVLRAADLAPVKRDVLGYLVQSGTVDECLAGYGQALSKTAAWRVETEAAVRQLRSDAAAGQPDTFDFAAEVAVIERDERDVDALFSRYAYAEVLHRQHFRLLRICYLHQEGYVFTLFVCLFVSGDLAHSTGFHIKVGVFYKLNKRRVCFIV